MAGYGGAPAVTPDGPAARVADMNRLRIIHTTIYRYARPVRFGEHRLQFRPIGSHTLRLIGSGLEITPAPIAMRWAYDVFGNSVALVRFGDEATELRFVSTIVIEHYGVEWPELPIDDSARTIPFAYSPDEAIDLGGMARQHYPDPEGALRLWVDGFAPNGHAADTQDCLLSMTRAIRESFRYQAREEEGTQSPAETLRLGSGSCRDFALLLMEACRSLGIAARFVSGYLYDPALDGGTVAMTGAGATHAWADIYLPGAGWLEFDPTNGMVGGPNLVRVAVTRDPIQASPISGTFTGDPGGPVALHVDVRVSREE